VISGRAIGRASPPRPYCAHNNKNPERDSDHFFERGTTVRRAPSRSRGRLSRVRTMTGKVISLRAIVASSEAGAARTNRTTPRSCGRRSKHPSRSSDPADVVPEAPNTQILELATRTHCPSCWWNWKNLPAAPRPARPRPNAPRARIEKAAGLAASGKVRAHGPLAAVAQAILSLRSTTRS